MVGLNSMSSFAALVALSLSATGFSQRLTTYTITKTLTEGQVEIVELSVKTATVKDFEFGPQETSINKPCLKKRVKNGKHEKGKLWGCPLGTICSPPDRCISEIAPDFDYVCEKQEYCVKAPPLIKDYQRGGKSLIQLPYYPLDPKPFGMTFEEAYGTFVNLHRRGMYPRDIPAALLYPVVEKRQENNETTSTATETPTSTTTGDDPTETGEDQKECFDSCRRAFEQVQGGPDIYCVPTSVFFVDGDFCLDCLADGTIDTFENFEQLQEARQICADRIKTQTPDPIESSSSTTETTTTTIPDPDTTTTSETTSTQVSDTTQTTTSTSSSVPISEESSSTTPDGPSDSATPGGPSSTDGPADTSTVTDTPPVVTPLPITATITRTAVINGTSTVIEEPTVTYEVPVNGAQGLVSATRTTIGAIVLSVLMFSIL